MSNLNSRNGYNVDTQKKEFRLQSALEISAQPDMEWGVDGVLPASGMACIYGPSGVGKSFLTLHLAAAIATGDDWFGYRTTRSRVVFLALEGQGGIQKRIAAWKAYHGKEYPPEVLFYFGDFDITTTDDPFGLLREIEHEGGAQVVIVDTLNRAMSGGDENGSQSMGQAIRGAMILQRITHGSVLFLHHPGKDVSKKLRGHSSLYAALDSILEVKAEGGAITWRTIKSKDGEGNLRHSFELKPVEFLSKSGHSLTSCVVVENGKGASVERAKPKGANQIAVYGAVLQMLVEQRVIAIMEKHQDEGLPLEYVRKEISGLLVAVDAKRRKERANEALDGLVAKGHFVLANGALTLGQQANCLGGE